MNLILLGAPGAGKGTQAENISKSLSVPAVSTGNIIREAVKNGTEMGTKAKSYIDAGHLVPDSVVIGIIKDRLAQEDCKNGFVLDGFPRTMRQAEDLDAILAEREAQVDAVVSLMISDEKVVDRIKGRAQVEGRADDASESVIRNRIATYHNQTEPLIAYYKAQGKYHEVSAEHGTIEEVRDRVLAMVDSL